MFKRITRFPFVKCKASDSYLKAMNGENNTKNVTTNVTINVTIKLTET